MKFMTGTAAHRIRWEVHADRVPDSGELLCLIEMLGMVREGLREDEEAEARWLMRRDQERMSDEGGRA